MYKTKDDRTPPLFPELFPLGGALNQENRWCVLAELINWNDIDDIYSRYFSNIGRPARDSRVVAGIFMVSLLEETSDEAAVELFSENPYILYFCGLGNFVTDGSAADTQVLVRARRRLGPETFALFEKEILEILASHETLGLKFSRTRKIARKDFRFNAGTFLIKMGRRLTGLKK